MKKNFQRPSFNFFKIYYLANKLALLVSRVLVFFIFLIFLGVNYDLFNLAIFIILIFFLFDFIKKRFQKIKKAGSFFGKTVNILLSIFIVFLSFNYFITLSDNINEFFLATIQIIEQAMNVFIFSVIILMLIIILYINIVYLFLDFIFKKWLNNVSEKLKLIIFFIFFTFPLPILMDIRIDPAVDFLVFKIGPVLGFSLFFLHLDYLIKEIKIIFKGKLNNNLR